MRTNMTSGRHSIWNSFSRASIGMGAVSAPAVLSLRPPACLPSSCLSRSGMSRAMISTTPSSSAFSAVTLALSRTADLAQSTLRWCLAAMDSMKLAPKLSSFFAITSSGFDSSIPPSETGLPPVELLEQVGHVPGDDLDDPELERLLRRDARARGRRDRSEEHTSELQSPC